jgi:hypothetical protein
MNSLSVLPAGLLLVAGVVLCFFGYRLLRLTLALAGFGVGLALGLALARLIPGTSQVFVLIVGLVLGVLGAVLATLLYKVGVFLLGAGAGVLIASVVLAATGWHYPMIARLLAAVAGGVLALILERPVISVLSALAGSWGVVLGAFRLLGWYHVDAAAKSPPANYGLLILAWIVVGAIGSVAQLSKGRGKKDEG